jgi:hypothetical protein
VFYYFPNNHTWSSAVMLCLMAGGQLGQIDRWLAPLRGADPDSHAWTTAWDNAAAQQEEHAKADLQQGLTRRASARYLRASTYYLTGERQTPPGPAKTRSYAAALHAFAAAMQHCAHPSERVEIDSADGVLPGHLIPAHATGPPRWSSSTTDSTSRRKSSTASSASSSLSAALPAWSSTPPAPVNRFGYAALPPDPTNTGGRARHRHPRTTRQFPCLRECRRFVRAALRPRAALA